MVALEVRGHLLDRPVGRAVDRLVATPTRLIHLLDPEAPDAIQEAIGAFDTGGVPVRTIRPGTHEHQEQSQAVRTVPCDVLVRRLDVAAGLRHLAAAEDDVALVPQVLEGLAEPEVAHVA